jgi:O-antigen/teichoic acid export membrane protein
MLMFNLPVFLTSVLFAKPLLSIFGDDFTTGVASMMILAIGTLAYTATGFGANILDMTDHPKVNTTNSVLMVFITIALNLVLIPQWGVVGAATASSLSMVMVNVLCLIEVWALLGMQPYNRSFLKPVIAGLAAALGAFLLNHSLDLPSLLQLILGGGLLWSVYALTLYLLKLSPEDRVVIERLLSRFRPKLPIAQDATP